MSTERASEWLIKNGFTNSQTEDIGSLASANDRDPIGTFCSSQWCHNGISKKGKLVSTQVINVCPFCEKGTHLFYSKVSRIKAADLQWNIDQQLAMRNK